MVVSDPTTTMEMMVAIRAYSMAVSLDVSPTKDRAA